MFRFPALFAFIIAFLARLGYSLYIQQIHPETIYLTDSWHYLDIAKNLFDQGIFSQMGAEPFTPDASRTPLYPAFITLFHYLKLDGIWIIFTQAFFGGATAWITVKTALIINRWNPANVFAGILVGLDIPSIFHSNVVATESLFTLILMCSVYYATKGVKFREEGAVNLSIVFMALATLCRPITLYFVAFIPLLYFFSSGFTLATRFKTMLAQIIVLVVFLGPWFYRNNQAFGAPFFSSISEVNLLFHTSTQVRAIAENRSQFELQQEYRKDLLGHLDFVNDASAIQEFRVLAQQETQQVLQKNQSVFVNMWAKSMVMFFIKPIRQSLNMQLKGDMKYESIASVTMREKGDLVKRTMENTDKTVLVLVGIQIIMLAIIYLSVLASLIIWIKKSPFVLFLIALLILYLAAASSLTEVDARFRVPAIPLLCLMGLPIYGKLFGKNNYEVYE